MKILLIIVFFVAARALGSPLTAELMVRNIEVVSKNADGSYDVQLPWVLRIRWINERPDQRLIVPVTFSQGRGGWCLSNDCTVKVENSRGDELPLFVELNHPISGAEIVLTTRSTFSIEQLNRVSVVLNGADVVRLIVSSRFHDNNGKLFEFEASCEFIISPEVLSREKREIGNR